MNDRIKELAKQAGLSYLYDYDADGHAMVCSEKDIKKFAELLIKETTNVIIIGHKGHMNPALATDSVKQHFGVEE